MLISGSQPNINHRKNWRHFLFILTEVEPVLHSFLGSPHKMVRSTMIRIMHTINM